MKKGMNLGEVSAAMGTGIDPGKAIGSVAAACECEYDGNIPISKDKILQFSDNKIKFCF